MATEPTTRDTKVFRYSWMPAIRIIGAALALVIFLGVVSKVSLVGDAAILGASLLFASYFAFLALRIKLVIGPEGVTFVERGQTTTLKWENIHGVSSAPIAGQKGARQYRLLTNGTVTLSFENEIAESERAYRMIERRISVDLYPRVREALERNEVVRFGVVELSKQTLQVRHISVPLSEARVLKEGHDFIVLRRETGDQVIAVDEAEVANINILMRAASEIDPHLVGVERTARQAA
jgi:hypothetical protein